MKVKEVIVVEGRDDTANIKQAVDADTIETNGSALSTVAIENIRHARDKRGVIIFTDPDSPGKRIRSLIEERVPGCKHAFLKQDEARSAHQTKRSLGIEHASVDAIVRALSAVYELGASHVTDITRQDLISYGLIGGQAARKRRDKLSTVLNIGHTNGKQLLRRLTMFQIAKKDLDEAMQGIIQKEQTDDS